MKRITHAQSLERLRSERDNLIRQYYDIECKARLEQRKPTAVEKQQMRRLSNRIMLSNAEIEDLEGGDN